MINITHKPSEKSFEASKTIFTKYIPEKMKRVEIKSMMSENSEPAFTQNKVVKLEEFEKKNSVMSAAYQKPIVTQSSIRKAKFDDQKRTMSDFNKDILEDMSIDDDFSDDEISPGIKISESSPTEDNKQMTESDMDYSNMAPPDMTRERHMSIRVRSGNLMLANPPERKTSDSLVPLSFGKTNSVAVSHDKIYDVQREIEQLKHALNVSNSEVQRLMLTKQSSSKNISCNYHLAFMFSSPLVRKVDKNLEMLMQLDYQHEIEGIEKQLKKANHEIKYRVEVGTLSNFRSVIADAPFALHFTGHGIENNSKSLGSVHQIYKHKGNILLFEDENSMADYLFEADLKRLVEISKANRKFSHNYEVVFVSSCHSEFAGNIFKASGANHVICIQKSETISDKASLRFSRVFYDTVFIKKY